MVLLRMCADIINPKINNQNNRKNTIIPQLNSVIGNQISEKRQKSATLKSIENNIEAYKRERYATDEEFREKEAGI